MALGVNRDYKTADRRARRLLATHNRIMTAILSRSSMDREFASKHAMDIIERKPCGYCHERGALPAAFDGWQDCPVCQVRKEAACYI